MFPLWAPTQLPVCLEMMFSRWPACERPEARSSNPSRRSSPPTMLMLPCSCPVPASMLAGPARLLPSNPRARARAGAGWKMPRRPRARRVAASHQMAGILSQALLALRRQSPQRPPGQPPHQLLQRLWKRCWSIAREREWRHRHRQFRAVQLYPPPSYVSFQPYY